MTTAMPSGHTPAANAWGRDVEPTVIDGHPCLVYAQRPRQFGALLADLTRWAERTCLVQGGRRVSYGELLARVSRLSADLQAQTVAGDPVMLLGYNSIEWVVAFWAVAQAGRVAVLGNAWWSPAEVAHAVSLIQPSLVVVDAALEAAVSREVPTLRMSTYRERPGREQARASLPREESDPALVVFTSGTTGAPKGVTLSNRAAVANIQNLLARTKRLPTEIGDDHGGTVSLMGLPLFHIGGVQSMCSALLSGGRIVFLDGKFEVHKALEAIASERVRFWGAVPTMVSRVLASPEFGAYDTSTVQSITMDGSMVPKDLVIKVRSHFPAAARRVGTVYGLTEAGGIVTAGSGDDLAGRPGTVGRPMPVAEVRVADTDEQGVGEVIVRSPAVMTRYWGEAECAEIDDDGWLRTGDLGRLDSDGYLYITGRIKDIIIRAGENIAAAHVEAALTAHPAVSEAAVVGLPNADIGEEVAAVIVLRQGETTTEADLAAFAADRLARFAVPSRWWIRATGLPVNSTGKVIKRALLEEVSAHLTAERAPASPT
jgi:long-chain acyl-CoA synthetase